MKINASFDKKKYCDIYVYIFTRDGTLTTKYDYFMPEPLFLRFNLRRVEAHYTKL